ncbi:hypothetical protein OROGR_013244 [Orobanche gracilis]
MANEGPITHFTIGVTWAPSIGHTFQEKWVMHDLILVGVPRQHPNAVKELDMSLLETIKDRLRESWPNLKGGESSTTLNINGLGLFDAIPKGYPFIVSTDYTPRHIRDTVAHFTGYVLSLLVLVVDNERQCCIEQRNVLDDVSFDHVVVQLMPTQPVDPRSLRLKRNMEEGGDRGR